MSNDLISRSVAIDEFYKRVSGDLTIEDIKYIENVLEEVPTACHVDMIGRHNPQIPHNRNSRRMQGSRGDCPQLQQGRVDAVQHWENAIWRKCCFGSAKRWKWRSDW